MRQWPKVRMVNNWIEILVDLCLDEDLVRRTQVRASFDVNDENHFNNLWVLSEDTYENSMRMEFWMIKHVVWTYRTNMIDHCVLNNKRKDYLYLYVVAEFLIRKTFSHLYTRMLKLKWAAASGDLILFFLNIFFALFWCTTKG